MQKVDKIIKIMAWLCISAITIFCIRFNYKMYHGGEDLENVGDTESQLNNYGVKNVLKK